MARGYEAKSAETSPTIRAMSSRGRRRARSAAAGALVAITVACSSVDGVSTDSASARTSAVPATTAPDAPATSSPPTTDTEAPVATDSAPPSAPDSSPTPTTSVAAEDVAEPIPGTPGTSIDWQRIDDHYDRGTLLVPVDYSDPSLGNFRLYLVRRRANDEDGRIGSLLVNPGGPGASGAEYAPRRRLRVGPEPPRPLRRHRLGPARHVRHRAGHRLHRRLRRLPHRRRHHARHARGAPAQHRPVQGVRGPLRRQERTDPPARRHQRLGARHGLHPPGARRGQDQLLRLQLRQRARGDVGDAVPRHRPGRRARRGQGPERRFPRLVSAAARRLRAHARAVPRGLRGRQRRARSTTTATPARRSTR